jgi:hypothetical protein
MRVVQQALLDFHVNLVFEVPEATLEVGDLLFEQFGLPLPVTMLVQVSDVVRYCVGFPVDDGTSRELDPRHWRVVALSVCNSHDASKPSWQVFESWRDLVLKSADCLVTEQIAVAENVTLVVLLLCLVDQFLNPWPHLLGLRHRRLDPVMQDQIGGQVPETFDVRSLQFLDMVGLTSTWRLGAWQIG